MKMIPFNNIKHIIILLVFINSLLFTTNLAGDDNPLTLKVGVVKTFPPQYIITESGEPQGLAIDIIESISNIANFSIEYIIKDTWSEMFLALESGEIDLIPDQGITEGRKEVFSFSNPVETFPVHMFTRNSYGELSGIEDLNNINVAVVKTNIGEVLVKEAEFANVKIFDEFEHALFELLSGNSDVLISPDPVIFNLARKVKVDNQIKSNGPLLTEIYRGISVLKGNEWILKKINPAINSFILTDEYKEIYIKWYGKETPFWNVKRVIIFMSLLTFIIILILLLWKYYSTEQIVKIRTQELIFKGCLLENIAEGVITIDLNRTITSCNSGSEKLFGYKEKDINGVLFKSLCHTTDFSLDTNLKKIDDLDSIKLDLTYIHKDKTKFDGLTSITKLFDEYNNHIGYIIIIEDITESKRADEKLKLSEEKFKALYDNTPLSYQSLNSDGTYKDVNAMYLKTLGYERHEIIGQSFKDLLHPDWKESFEKNFAEFKKYGHVNDIEFKIRHKDGHYIDVLLEGAMGYHPDGRVRQSYCVFTDITERKKIDNELLVREERLHQSQKMQAIGQLAGGMAHDFNNIISGIMGSAQLLQSSERKLDEKSHKYVNIILQSSIRAAKLIENLLLFSRKEEPTSDVVDIESVIGEIYSIVENTIDKKIRVLTQKNTKNSFVFGNSSRLHNIFLNLCINASQSITDSGEIKIITENIYLDQNYCDLSSFDIHPNNYCRISVIDSGCGINAAILDKIFDPFFTTKAQGKGTGLGLSAVYGSIIDLNGEILVTSEVGVGTSFVLNIPSYNKPFKVVEKQNVISTEIGTILVVDDEEINRILNKEILESFGYKVLFAKDGLEAIEIFSEKYIEIDIVLMDMIMPKMNGSEAFYKMKEIDANCKVIITSGFTRDENIEELINYGLAGFISKPYTISEINQLLHGL